jgi:hypothetical protein
MFFGILLIVLGGLLLLDQLGLIRGSIWGYVLPLVIIAVGIRLIIGRGKPQP